jgi:hypothetical protein
MLVFLSYRRADSDDIVGRIYDRLVKRFGKAAVFKDVDSIPLSADFRMVIDNSLSSCQVFLAVIGQDWLTLTEDNGGRRLDNPRDYVRLEIEMALERGIPIIPVLVRRATMPSSTDLPLAIRSLEYCNGISVRSDPDFHRDMDRLIEQIERLNPKQLGREFRMEPITATTATVASAIAAYILPEAFKEGGKALGKGVSQSVSQLITVIREKFREAKKEGTLADFEAEQTEENQSEFETALKKLMSKDKDFDQKLKELFVQLELSKSVPLSIQQVLIDVEAETLAVGDIKQKTQQENSNQTIMKNGKLKSINMGNITQKS